jgi:hypothetical protein
MNAYEAGNIAQANSIREFGSVGDIFELKNDAQKSGAFSSIFIPLGTLVKAGAGASKAMKAEKALDTASNTTKTANIASDTAKLPTQAKLLMHRIMRIKQQTLVAVVKTRRQMAQMVTEEK